MRIGLLVLATLVGQSSATFALAGAAGGAAALASSLGSLATIALPAKFFLPLALPPLLLFKLSKLGLLAKVPFLAAIGAKKYAIVKAKVNFGKHVVKTAYNTKLALVELPFKVGAMKIGALAGAKAGAAVGLDSFNKLSKPQFLHPVVIPASALIQQTGLSAAPSDAMPTDAYAAPDPEEVQPVYGSKLIPTTTTTTERPVPAYVPPQPSYVPPKPVRVPPRHPYTPRQPAYAPEPAVRQPY